MSEKGPARVGAILAALAVLVAAILAYEAGRRGRPPVVPARSEGAEPALAGPADTPAPREVPAESSEPEPSGLEASAVFDKPVAPPEPPQPAAVNEAVAVEPVEPTQPVGRRGERRDAAQCLRLDVTPTYVEAHRAAGPMVQLTVRAHNDCAFSFEGQRVAFRISATSPDGFELANTVAQFSNELPPYGSAQTTVDLLCDATRVARYRVELR